MGKVKIKEQWLLKLIHSAEEVVCPCVFITLLGRPMALGDRNITRVEK